jgi:hypothetical protein
MQVMCTYLFPGLCLICISEHAGDPWENCKHWYTGLKCRHQDNMALSCVPKHVLIEQGNTMNKNHQCLSYEHALPTFLKKWIAKWEG